MAPAAGRSPTREPNVSNSIPAADGAGENQNFEINTVFGPNMTNYSSTNTNPPNHRRDSPPTSEVPRRAGPRSTRNPAPVYCQPLKRKRRAAGADEGKPPKKKRKL